MKTHVEKMSFFGLSIMLMKTNDLPHSFHYIDENKGESCLMRAQQKVACSHSSLLTLMDATVISHGQDGHATPLGHYVEWGRSGTLPQQRARCPRYVRLSLL
jgi:hypothetical protein